MIFTVFSPVKTADIISALEQLYAYDTEYYIILWVYYADFPPV